VLEGLYSEAYYEEHGMGAGAVQGWPERARGILSMLPEGVGSVLDVGAGPGHLVSALRALGMRADGVEPSAGARACARRLHGLALLAEMPDPACPPYDAATLVHVLEHVPAPAATLLAIAARLAPGAGLYVEVPHAASVEMWRPAERRRILDLPRHLHHFTPPTLLPLLAAAGFVDPLVFLSNPAALERVLALRARLRGRRSVRGPAADAHTPTGFGEPARGGLARAWGERILPALRRRFPGATFQVVARRSGKPEGP
jgi:SAM-dependent methyltransferase